MSGDYAALAARAVYTAAGHGDGGMLSLTPLDGRENPNVIDLDARRGERKVGQRRD